MKTQIAALLRTLGKPSQVLDEQAEHLHTDIKNGRQEAIVLDMFDYAVPIASFVVLCGTAVATIKGLGAVVDLVLPD